MVKNETTTYLKWLSILCVVMALFGVGVFIVGYKDLSFGRVATVVALLLASAGCYFLSRKKVKKDKATFETQNHGGQK